MLSYSPFPLPPSSINSYQLSQLKFYADKKWGKSGKDRIDDEEITFQRMVAKGPLPFHWAALHMFRCKRLLENVEDTFMDVVQDLLKRVVEVKPKRPRVASPSNVDPSSTTLSGQTTHQATNDREKEKSQSSSRFSKAGDGAKLDNPVKSLLAAYESSDDED
ncbi:UNVERIFIED_CONTAM: hypothetical protein Scaly_1833800 [Sesamum calycinum]|uniref:Uncharacterized protein n=1 Tax=Sesamum calycinum TaxID=2727403 RepID=A0AAW2NFS0_9LAMI